MRVLIVDDHRLFAEAIVPTLQEAGHEVVGVASDGSTALDMARRERPDAVLMDLGLGGEDGTEVGREVLVELPETKVVALTAREDHRAVETALRAGFQGYISKDTGASRFSSILERIGDGETVLAKAPPTASGRDEDDSSLRFRQLTPRERELLELLVEGLGNDEIAAAFSISTNTVRTHVQNVLAKLQVGSRLQAVAFAIRQGMSSPRTARYTTGTGASPSESSIRRRRNT